MINMKKFLSLLAALVLALSAVHLSAAETAPEVTFGNLTTENEYRGTASDAPLTEADITGENTQILKDGDIIHTVLHPVLPQPITNETEALEAACRLMPLLGAEADAELGIYGVLKAGTQTVYAFTQLQGDEPIAARNMKIAVHADGTPAAIFSSLAYPAETPESLGETEDPMTAAMEKAEIPAVPDFEHMKKETYTGEITENGTTRTLTVPVLQDPDTGLYYLGDAERKIIVGDFHDMVLEGKKDCLVTLEKNEGWEETDLLMYERLIEAWDWYAAMGWKGPDGLGTPVMLLRNLELLTGEDMNNAAYTGILGDWQTFSYSKSMNFGRSLDVVAHEFTHCVTDASTCYNMYMNDYGAINESMSDIMGNLCETSVQQQADDWTIGEDLDFIIRSMADPRANNQPAYAWDLYYGPAVELPNDVNDRGGVHSNSSLASLIAAKLCTEEGMSADTAARFWLAVDMGLLARTDYPKLESVMLWALDAVGATEYQEAVTRLAKETRLSAAERPEQTEEGRKLVTLTLPETEAMLDNGWLLQAYQIHTKEVIDFISEVVDEILSESPEGAAYLEQILSWVEDLSSDEIRTERETYLPDSEITKKLKSMLSSFNTWAPGVGKPISLLLEQDYPTLYLLVNMDPETLDFRGLLVYTGSGWLDLMAALTDMLEEGEVTAENAEAQAAAESAEAGESLDERLMELLFGVIGEFLAPSTAGSEPLALETAGLENVTLENTALENVTQQ